jgi:hypothetical protein
LLFALSQFISPELFHPVGSFLFEDGAGTSIY